MREKLCLDLPREELIRQEEILTLLGPSDRGFSFPGLL